MSRRLVPAVLVASLLCLGSCAWSIGDGDESFSRTHPTLGEELRDLKQACEEGAISQQEYEVAKRELIESARNRGSGN